MSTARQLGGGTVFDRELDEADKIIAAAQGARTSLRILLASPAPEWLGDTPVAGGSGSLRALAARLRELKPNDGAADMLECVQAALQAEPAGKDVSRFITVVTDGQAHGWRAETPGVWDGHSARWPKKRRCRWSLRVVVPEGVSGPVANLAVEKMTAARAVVGVGQPVTLTASIKNTGNQRQRGDVAGVEHAGRIASGVSTVPGP